MTTDSNIIDTTSLIAAIEGADLLYVDPPWKFGRDAPSNGFSGSCRKHYPGLSVEELQNMPIKENVANDCICLMWSTSLHLPAAINIMTSWGFKHRGVFQTFIKVTKKKRLKTSVGLYNRSSTEFLLLGIRGKVMPLLSDDRNVCGVLMEETRRHSQKPESARNRIDQRFSNCSKRVELFSRESNLVYPWSGWGNENTTSSQQQQ
jgi:N6-adenosine-specific RNA methylase IME4